MRSDRDKRTIKELGLRSWLTDVLWYHYKWAILISILIIVIGATMLRLTLSQPENDADIIIAVSEVIDSQKINDIKLAIGDVLGDVNGDGQIIINVLQLILNPTGGTADPNVSSNNMTMTTSLYKDEFVFFLCDKKNAEIYSSSDPSFFNHELAALYGGSKGYVPLGELPLFKKLGLTDENQLYGCFKTKAYFVKTDDERYYAQAREIFEGLVAFQAD